MTAIAGTVHEYAYKKTAFEFNVNGKTAANVLLFIGGLTDGLLTVHYLPKLAETVRALEGDWVLVQGLLTSAYMGWGQSSLEKDNQEIGKIVSYLRSEKGGNRQKVVLMGHLTGCQDCLRYLCHYSYQEKFDKSMDIDGGILQAPVSDREGVALEVGEQYLDSLCKEVYDDYITQGLANQMLPLKFSKVSFGTPITAYRFYSLYLKYGDDDFFSSYFTDDDLKQTFGKVRKPLLSLYGEKDEFSPDFIDKQALLRRWQQAVDVKYWNPLSKVLPKASHTVDDPDAVEDLTATVATFLLSI